MQTTIPGTMALVTCLGSIVKVEIAGRMFKAATQVVFGNQETSPFHHPVPSHGRFLQYDASQIILQTNESVLIPYPGSYRTYLHPNSTVTTTAFVTPACLTAFLIAGNRPANLLSTMSTLIDNRSLLSLPPPTHTHTHTVTIDFTDTTQDMMT
jgi:hypothetical protein